MLETIGSTPRAAVRTVSLACRAALSDLRQCAWLSACSGGADSLAMTILAAELALRWQVPFRAVVVDHQLRAESATEANAALAELSRWGIGALITRAETDVGSRQPRSDSATGRISEPFTDGLEAFARQRRYRLLTDAANDFQQETGRPVAVLLGHTMDDQAETVLLGLAHGAGGRSLAGMQTRRPRVKAGNQLTDVTWVRPLLGVRRADTLAAIEQLGARRVEDPTNTLEGPWRRADGGPLPRLAVRHQVLPALAKALGKDPVPALARTATHLQDDNEYLQQQAAELLRTAHQGQGAYRVEILRQAPAALRGRALVQLCRYHCGGRVHHRQVGDVERLITNYHGQGPVDLPGGVQCMRQRDDDGQAVVIVVGRAQTVGN